MDRKNSIIVVILIVVLAGAALFYLFYPKLSGGQVLVTVNGENITVRDFNQETGKVKEQTRGIIKEEPAKFLEGMIVRTLILQEAKKQGLLPARKKKDHEGSISSENAVIKEFIEEKFSSVPAVSQKEIEAFYEIYKDRMEGKSLEQVAPMIEQIIRQGKQQKQLEQFIGDLRKNATVEINEEVLQKITVKAPDSNTEQDFLNALQSGKPVLVDFGSNSCLPCRQMRPILQAVGKEYLGKAEVIVIDVYKYQALANKHKIYVTPTLTFFDSNGKEVYRHQGFMSKKLILKQFKKLGIS
ncbi:MAG: thioredoxin fold domain-containing protein [Deltaproteobacteria bacterium]|nr:thioredoxin fold domain-containing protein [Deltaproteobacteria bacterium]MBW2663956.1 thioredoxin fold domain-containing protein [Deltaproteobacteria bacterium]